MRKAIYFAAFFTVCILLANCGKKVHCPSKFGSAQIDNNSSKKMSVQLSVSPNKES